MIGEEQEKLDLFHRHCQDEDPAGVNMQPMLNLPSSVYFIIGCLLMELDSMREGTERNILADASKVVKKNKSVK
ncbi:unnamed protein product [Brassica napus]|uniref:(rape) hypothetical protein n=1 Tax=Brassica napus TaxID=3708 RepID=A0A816IVH5_BRANA|nr:unnamed protein product [Brassica napus]